MLSWFSFRNVLLELTCGTLSVFSVHSSECFATRTVWTTLALLPTAFLIAERSLNSLDANEPPRIIVRITSNAP